MNIKTVDYNSSNAGKELAQSLHETGFAVLHNHPINYQLFTDVVNDWAKFFDREDKHDYTFSKTVRYGYYPFLTETSSLYDKPNINEYYHHNPVHPLPNGMSNITNEYYDQVAKMAVQVATWLEQEIPDNIKEKFDKTFVEMVKESTDNVIRLLHYPPIKGDEPEGSIRIYDHADTNFFTILPAATQPGLQVQDINGNWIEVPVEPGQIIINSGNMLKLLTDGYFQSTLHRVINPIGELSHIPRYSIPTFIQPNRDIRLNDEFTAGEYLFYIMEKENVLGTD